MDNRTSKGVRGYGRALVRGLALLALLLPSGCGWIAIGILVGTSSSGGSGSAPPPSRPPNVDPEEAMGRDGPIQVSYTLVNEPSESVTVFVEFSLDDGESYQPISVQPPRVVGNLDSGRVHTFTWQSKAEPEVGEAGFPDAQLRLTPTDDQGTEGETEELPPFKLGNDAPVLSDVTVLGDGGNIVFELELSDSTTDLAALQLEFETSMHSRQPLDLASGSTADLNTSFEGTSHTYVWDSRADIPGQTLQASVYLLPSDELESGVETTLSVLVDNNQRPSVQVVRPSGDNSGDIGIVYFVRDEERQNVEITVEYSVDGGPFQSATEAVGPPSEGTSGLASLANGDPGNQNVHRFVWDAFADLGWGNDLSVKVRIEPFDSSDGFAGVTEPTFVVQHGPFRRDATLQLDEDTLGVLLPQRVAVGDLDGNGFKDVVVPLSAPGVPGGLVLVLLQQAVDTFALLGLLPTPGRARWAAVGDYNGDGLLDIAVAQEEAQFGVVVALQGPGLDFSNFIFKNGPLGSVAEDLVNIEVGDPARQLLVASYEGVIPGTSPLRLLEFQAGQLVDTGPTAFLPGPGIANSRRVAVGDWDGDGFEDLVAISGSEPPELVVYRQDAPMSRFLRTDLATPFAPPSGIQFQGNYIALGDFDGDGLRSDLSFTTESMASMGGSGGLYTASIDPVTGLLSADATELRVSLGAGSLNGTAIADVNGDLRGDVIALKRFPLGPSEMGINLSLGSQGFEATQVIEVGHNGEELFAGDADGDGSPDVITSHQNPNGPSISFFKGEAPRAPSPFKALQGDFQNPQAVALGDFNGDQTVDIVFTVDGALGDNIDGLQVFFFGLGFETLLGPDFPFMDQDDPDTLAAGDFNGDGSTDLLVGLSGIDRLVLFEQLNQTLQPTTTGFQLPNRPRALAAGDIDGDGLDDAVAVTRDEVILLQQSMGMLVQRSGMGTFGGRGVALAELNGQPGLEVVVANHNDLRIDVYTVMGPDLVLETSVPVPVAPRAVAVGILGEDTEPSLVAVCDLGQLIRARQVVGGPLSFEPPEAEQYSPDVEFADVVVADLNSDGRGDIAASMREESELLYLYDGNPDFEARSLVGLGPEELAAGDINGDGHDDLVLTRTVQNKVGLLIQR